MSDKTEWELVDEAPRGGHRQPGHAYEQAYRRPQADAFDFGSNADADERAAASAAASAAAGAAASAAAGRAGIARAILGPRWKFKVAGMAAVASVLAILAIMLTGIVFLVVAGVALLSFVLASLRRLLRGPRKPSAYPFPERRRHDWPSR